jgi:hypothetical protein
MNLLIYATPLNRVWERLHRTIQSTDFTVTILVASNYQELLGLVTLSALLADLRIILILPDRNKSTIAKAHTLRPRFLTCLDNGLNDVAIVLNKMLENENPDKIHGGKVWGAVVARNPSTAG